MWTVDVPVNGTVTVTVIVKVVGEGNITNLVIVGNKNVTETITSHNFTLTKEAITNGSVYVGDEVTYRIVVNNTGSEPIRNLTVTDILPEGVTFVSATGNYTYANGKVIWTIDVGVNSTVVLYVTVIADKEGIITNVVISANENSTCTINVTKKDQPVPPGPEPTPEPTPEAEVTLPNTGNPLLVLLLMLIVIPIFRRKERK